MSRTMRLIAPLIVMTPLHAVADPPQSEQFIDVGFALLPPIDCGTFLLNFEMSGERARVTTFFDQNGEATRMRVRFIYFGTLTHSGTGMVLRDQSTLNITTDVSTNTTKIVGVGFHYSIPGEGLIFVEAGQLVFGPDGSILFQAGQHDEQAAPNFRLLCEALSD